jgi:hypothetical protein
MLRSIALRMLPTVRLPNLNGPMVIGELATQAIIKDTILEAPTERKTRRCTLNQPGEFSLMADTQHATSPTYIRQAALGIAVSAVTQRGVFLRNSGMI